MFLGKVVGTVWSTKNRLISRACGFWSSTLTISKRNQREYCDRRDRLGAGTGEMLICLLERRPARPSAIRKWQSSRRFLVLSTSVDITDTVSEECAQLARELHETADPSHCRLPTAERRGGVLHPSS